MTEHNSGYISQLTSLFILHTSHFVFAIYTKLGIESICMDLN